MATGYIMLDTPNPTTAQGTYPRRGGFRPSGTVIVHTSEGAWTAGVDSLTRLVRTRADYGCYHRACDWQDIALYYPWEWECWQDSETNNWAVGIAAACKTTDWAVMPADIREGYYRNLARMAADFVVYMRDEYGVTVPLRRLSGAEARARVPGFCAHGDSGIARSDPGRDFDWPKFFEYTRQVLAGEDTQEDTLSADMPMTSKDGVPVTLEIQLQSIDRKVEDAGKALALLPALDADFRGEFDIMRADRAAKDAQIAALTEAVKALATANDGVDSEDILQTIRVGMDKFRDSYQVKLERVAPATPEG